MFTDSRLKGVVIARVETSLFSDTPRLMYNEIKLGHVLIISIYVWLLELRLFL